MKAFIRSFGFAFQGIWVLIRTERNFQIHLLALCLVVTAGIFFELNRGEWMLIFGVSALVLSLEAINSAVEKLCDLYSMEQNPKIKIIKDVAAGAVLIASIFAALIGLFIFWPRIEALF